MDMCVYARVRDTSSDCIHWLLILAPSFHYTSPALPLHITGQHYALQ